ncbi:MAG: hypothetical protein J6U10_03635 [Lachnospiraceae bacterium]|nr:hypothetical protein [Lachnospiraceae bacterium]MBP5183717.1 hypothetical protein [Lachnospiraceae bacterium]
MFNNGFVETIEQCDSCLNELELVKVWDTMPWQIAELYVPTACISDLYGRAVYMAENRLDSTRVVVITAVGAARETLRKESDIMDLLVLNCIPKKLFYKEESERSVLVREYIKGESLGGAVARLGAFPEADVREFGEELCEMFKELYERSLMVDPGTLVARNIIFADGRMKFVEPNGIEYGVGLKRNWNRNEAAIGELMEMLLIGNGTGYEPAASKGLQRVIAKCKAGAGRNFGSVEALLAALKETEPERHAKAVGTAGILAIVAALLVFIVGFSAATITMQRNNPSDKGIVDIDEDYIPGDAPVIRSGYVPFEGSGENEDTPTPTPEEENK